MAEIEIVDAPDAPEEEDAEELELDAPEEEETVVYDEDAPNLVEAFMATKAGKKELRRIAEFVDKEFRSAWEGQSGYRDRMAANQQIWSGDLPTKDFPYENCANTHIPIMFENVTRIVMRIEAEIFGDWTNIMGVLPVGPDDRDTADLLTRHGNWQLSEQLTDFRRQMKRMVLRLIKDGDVVVHSYYDTAKKRNRHETLTSDEFLTPHVHSTVEPDFSDCPWVAKILYRYRHEIQRMRDEWHDVDAVIDRQTPSWDDEPNAPLREEIQAENEIEETDESKPYKLIHWEGWLELTEEDVNDRYCKVVMDQATKGILQLQILEEEDWQDKRRFEKQMGDLEAYRAKKMQNEVILSAYMAQQDLMASGVMPIQPVQELPMEPMPPEWVEDPAALEDPSFAPQPTRKVPIHMFSHGVCIEPLAGSLGMGYGNGLADHNRGANTMMNQFVDQATLSNAKSFITAGGVTFDKPIQMAPGRVNVAKGTTPRDLKDAFHELSPGPANPQLVEAVQMIQGWAQSSVQAPDVLSGESGKSGETYRGLNARIDQATKQLSVTAGVAAAVVTQVLKNNAKLNAQFLPEEEVVAVNNHKLGTVDVMTVNRKLYERDYRVTIKSDLRFASQQQRITEADQTLQMVTSLPPLQQNIALIQKALAEVFIARSQDHLVPYLGQPLPPPMTPLGLPPTPPPGMAPPGAPPPVGPPQGQPPQPPSAPPEGV